MLGDSTSMSVNIFWELSPDANMKKIDFSVGGEFFHCVGQHITVKGYTSIMPWVAVNAKNIPQFTKGERIEISKAKLYEGNTMPPEYLSESELISLMVKNGIGMDASISVHINNICERNYVQISVCLTFGVSLSNRSHLCSMYYNNLKANSVTSLSRSEQSVYHQYARLAFTAVAVVLI